MTNTYNKLVRDKIPEIIRINGDTCKTKILSNEEYIGFLDIKLNEEVAEYQSDKSIEEIADILEVIYAIAKTKGYSIADLERIRLDKVITCGGFDKKVFLIEVNYNERRL